jgi:hypothetical protein
VLLVSVLAAWGRFARGYLPLRVLLATPFYVLWKLPLYLGFVWRREKSWVRASR